MLFSRAGNTVTAKSPRQMGTGSAHTSRLTFQQPETVASPGSTRKGLCSQQPLHPSPLHLAMESSWPSAAVTGSRKLHQDHAMSCETTDVGKGDRQLPRASQPSPGLCLQSASMHRGEFGVQGRGKTEGQISADGLQNQLKWDELHGTSHLPLRSLGREENTIQPSQDQPVHLLCWNLSLTPLSGVILFPTTPGQEDLDSPV